MKGPEKFPDGGYVCVGKSEDVTQPRLLKASQKGKRDKAFPFSFAGIWCDIGYVGEALNATVFFPISIPLGNFSMY